MIGTYTHAQHFAYPGWRLTVPGGPAGGHYKGFTHTQAAGTDIPPQDQYEQDREDGMSSHDAVHATPRNPRGVYRSSAEVPPRPNASGSAMIYTGFQTKRHAGTSVAPGSFPAPYTESGEDSFLSGLGLRMMVDGDGYGFDRYVGDAPPMGPDRPNTVNVPTSQMIRTRVFDDGGVPFWGDRLPTATPMPYPAPITGGATNTVPIATPQPYPAPPSPAVPVRMEPPISPRPSPVVRTREVIPHPDHSGHYLDVSTGDTVSASDVEQNPATGQLHASHGTGAMSWLEEHSLVSSFPNWGVIAAGLLAASMFMGKHR